MKCLRGLSPPRILAALVVVHIVWGLARVPGKVLARRVDDVATYRANGGPAFFLSDKGLRGAAAIEWVLANTPAECVVLWEGDPMGSLEFAPVLLAPRLVVHAKVCPPTQERYAGLPVARAAFRAETGARAGAIVIVAAKTDLHIEVR